MSEEQKPEETKPEEVNEQVQEEVKPSAEDLLKNREAELARKNAEIADMKLKLMQREQTVTRKKDPNDITTWDDHELKAVRHNNQYAQYHEQIDEILLDRKLEAKMAVQVENNKRVTAEMQLREKFPEALNPSSALAMKMEQIIAENDLSKTPAGRLVAAKLAAAELSQGDKTSDARGRKIEADRVSRVKGQLVDGDRPKPTDVQSNQNLDDKRKSLAEKLINGNKPGAQNEKEQVDAVAEILKDRGLDRNNFFKR